MAERTEISKVMGNSLRLSKHFVLFITIHEYAN